MVWKLNSRELDEAILVSDRLSLIILRLGQIGLHSPTLFTALSIAHQRLSDGISSLGRKEQRWCSSPSNSKGNTQG